MSQLLSQRLRAFLAERGGHVSIAEVCRFAFAGDTPTALGKRLLETALPNELQFSGDEVYWLAPSTQSDTLAETRFVVVDLETTGLRPDRDEVLEFAAVYVRGEKIEEEIHELFSPSAPIPPFISQLTGIDNDLIEGKPRFFNEAHRFHSLFADVVPVAHNAAFDFRFLDSIFLRRGLPTVGDGKLCTMQLARKFLSGRKFNLDAVAEQLGVATENRHRALADARITAHVLIELLRRAGDAGIESIAALRNTRGKPKGRGVETRLRVGPERVRAIPEKPGVYRFRDPEGRVLYVGKALNLRNRLGSYFVGSKKGKIDRMLSEIKDFDYTVVGSELEALLEEATEIRSRKPKYNAALRNFKKYGYIRWERDDPFPALRFSKDPGAPEKHESYGPFRFPLGGRNEVKALRETFRLRNCRGRLKPNGALSACVEKGLGRCNAPCNLSEDEPAYAGHVERLREFLTGEGSVLEDLRKQIADASAKEHFERAASLRDRHQTLLHVFEAAKRTKRLALKEDRMLILPAAEPGYLRLYHIRPGMPLTTAKAHVQSADWPKIVAKLLTPPKEAGMGRLDDARIAESWVRRKPGLCLVDPTEYEDEAALARALTEAVRTAFGDSNGPEQLRLLPG